MTGGKPMLEINLCKRNSGKTTRVIQMMKQDPKILLIIPFIHHKKQYPKNLHHRIISGIQFLNGLADGMTFDKVVLDEGFAHPSYRLAEIYYNLGRFYPQCKVIAYGTAEEQLLK
jgi:hypothetical protein